MKKRAVLLSPPLSSFKRRVLCDNAKTYLVFYYSASVSSFASEFTERPLDLRYVSLQKRRDTASSQILA